MNRIAHLTSVHPPYDTRIFIKMCRSLVASGYDVHLVVPHDEDSVTDDVNIHAISKRSNRLMRYTRSSRDVLERAVDIEADIYHFHDPELMQVGLQLKAMGKTVVYDVHENYRVAILDKAWIPKAARPWLARRTAKLEDRVDRSLDGIVAATPAIASLFKNANCTLVQNFPIIRELTVEGPPFSEREPYIVYVGGISAERGAKQMVQAMSLVRSDLGARLILIGPMPVALKRELEDTPGWDKVDYMGPLGRVEVAEQMSQSVAGLLLFLPFRNHIESQPNKMFEYMSAGLPVIASDFEHWRAIMDPVGCGWNVDPANPQDIARMIESAIEDRGESESKGAAGLQAVERAYNWDEEFKKLDGLYDRLLSETDLTAR